MSERTLTIEPHPLLRVAAFTTEFSAPLAALSTTPAVLALLGANAPAPIQRDEAARAAVRDMLRHGGYKPTGRGKPAAEYLLRAAAEGGLGSINQAVDVCNAVSLHSGLPVSVVDLGRAHPPFRIGVAAANESYIFNASGQEIDLSGLLCLFDAEGACANAVRDAQRTKTHPGTTATLSVIWGCAGYEGRLRATERWYRSLLEDSGASTTDASMGWTSA